MRVYLELLPLSGLQYPDKGNVDHGIEKLLCFVRQLHALSSTVTPSLTRGNIVKTLNKKLSSLVILRQWHTFPGPQFPQTYNEDSDITYHLGLL